jgi:hypothetical protein
MTEEIEKKLDCLILLNCMNDAPEETKLRIAVNCLGLRKTAKLLGKDHGNLSKKLNKETKKNGKKSGSKK